MGGFGDVSERERGTATDAPEEAAYMSLAETWYVNLSRHTFSKIEGRNVVPIEYTRKLGKINMAILTY